MRLLSVIGTAVLSLTIVAPVYAQQEQHEQKEEEKAKPEEKEKKAQPEKPVKQEQGRAQEEKNTRPEEKNAKQEQQRTPQAKPEKQEQHANSRRIPDDRYKANFDGNTVSGLAKATTAITASNMAVTGSDSPARGRAIGFTRKTFMSST